MSAYIKDRKISNKNLMLHLRLLEKQEQARPKTSRSTEKIKIGAEINEIETKETVQRINETKSWFTEKINKIDRSLANMTKMRRENPKLVKSEMKKRDNNKHQGIIRDYFENLYSNKFENFNNIDKFLYTLTIQN
jgi:hypothetical protein